MARAVVCVFLLLLYIAPALSSANHAAFVEALSNNLKDPSSCDRECDGTPMDCYYDLKVESYSTLSKACYLCPSVLSDCYRPHCVPGNGLQRLILSVNRQMPGPQIRVCHGDTVIVNVTNLMYNTESLSMHWHGLFQTGTPYMDGVGMVSQCAIQSGATWTYRFKADPVGTHWYHSHTGPQRADGVHGAVIVKDQKSEERNSGFYDKDLAEHVLILSDFEKVPAVVKAVLHEQAKGNNKPDYLLINGHGSEDDLVVEKPSWYKKDDWTERTAPHYVLNVTKGMKYRIRLISNALLNCPMEVFIQEHNFTAISSDGSEIEPVTANIVTIAGGERWDIILHADQEVDNYWLYVRGLTDCAPNNKHIQQLAVIHYDGAPEDELPEEETDASLVRNMTDDWEHVNPLNMGLLPVTSDDPFTTLPEITSLESVEDWIEKEPDHVFYLGLDLHWVDNQQTNHPVYYSQDSQLELGGRSVIAQINRISGTLPDRPYLSQYNEIPTDKFCTYDSSNHDYIKPECKKDGCYCIHRMMVKVGDIVELVLIDEGKPFNASNHPMHLHGQYMAIVAAGQDPSRSLLRKDVMAMDKRNEITRNFKNPILKDTIMLPDGGYVVTKLKADNPGAWLMHCHNEVHATQGMNIVLEVGGFESWPLLENLPKCGSYHYNDPVQQTKESSNAGRPVISYVFCVPIVSILYSYCTF